MPAPAPQTTPLPLAASNEMRLQRLEGDLRTMTGKQEESAHKIQLLQQSLDQMGARLSVLEQKLAAPTPTPVAAQPSQVSVPSSMAGMPPQPSAAGGLTGPDMAPPAAGYRFTSGTVNAPATNVSPSDRGGSVTTAATRLSPPDRTAADTPDAAYGRAHALFLARKYGEAEGAFQAFLSRYPKNPLAANAQFWVGECQYARKVYDKAAKSFAIAYQNYPQGPKGADSLLKLGISLNYMGKKTEACLTWAQLKKQFPDAGATLTRSDDEAKKAGCQG